MTNVFVPAPGAGVVALTAASLSQVIQDGKASGHADARYWGVVGDGASVDTAAFQAALNACSGQVTLVIPSYMTVVLDATVTIPGNTVLILDGTILRQGGNSTVHSILEIVGSNVRITGKGKIDGNRANQTGAAGGCAGISSGEVAIADILISGIEICNVINWPINLTNNVTNATVFMCRLHDSGNSCEMNSATNSSFLFNEVYNINDGGIALYGGDFNCAVKGNTVYSCIGGIGIYSDTAQPTPDSRCDVSDNTVYNIANYGISVAIAGEAVSVMHTWCRVYNNRGFGNGTSGVGGTGSYKFSNVSGLSVRGNSAIGDLGQNPYPLGLSGPMDNVQVVGNTIGNCGVPGGLGSFGICCINNASAPTNIVLADNIIYDTRGAGSASAYAIYTDGGFLNVGCVVEGNHAIGTFTQASPFYINPIASGVVVEGYMSANNSTLTKTYSTTLVAPGFSTTPAGIALVQGALRIGQPTVASQALVDFFSSGSPIAADARILVLGGIPGTGFLGQMNIYAGRVVLPGLHAQVSFANDAAAAAGGVPVDGIYRNGSALQIRVA